MDHRSESDLAGAVPGSQVVSDHVRRQLAEFRRNLLDLTTRNPLLAFDHKPRAQTHVRIIDELPDLVFEGFGEQREFTILALEDPRMEPDDEDTPEFKAVLASFKQEDPVYLDELRALKRRDASPAEYGKLDREQPDYRD